MSASELDLKDRMLIAAAPVIFDINVDAKPHHGRQGASLRYSITDSRRATKDVTITSVPHADLSFCSKNCQHLDFSGWIQGRLEPLPGPLSQGA